VLLRLAHDSLPSTWSYYTMLKFSWGPADVAWSLVAVGALSALSFAVLPRLLTPRLGETRSVFLGLAAGAIGYAGYAFAPNPATLYAFMVVFCFGGVGGAALNAILSHLVPDNEQGELQGTIASIGSLTAIAAPLLMTGLFAHFTSPQAPVYFPGAAFLAAAICELGALAIFAGAKARKAKTVEPVT
jgi:DHA1 family tetracycline resistance protein-like MFS transporter